MPHTPGPMEPVYVHGAILGAGQRVANPYLRGRLHEMLCNAVAGQGTDADRRLAEANMRRICACWNACQDIPTEALEAGVVAELLAACEAEEAVHNGRLNLAATLIRLPANDTRSGQAIRDAVIEFRRAAIAKARGNQPREGS